VPKDQDSQEKSSTNDKSSSESSSSDELSLEALSEKKDALTSEVRKEGITEKDEAFLDNFSEEMTASKNSEEKAKDKKYQPNDAEINDKLSKAKNINKNIMKSTHPEEYKKQQEQEAL